MGDFYEYTTPEQQIQKLKEQNLLFGDENMAKEILKIYGYYNIINGYREPYIVRNYDRKVYTANVSFEQIFSLFRFDHNLRNAIMLSMIDLEEHLRAIVADIIAEHFGSDYREYLKENHYRDKRISDPKFSRNNILNSMRKTANTAYSNPIKYYREKYGEIPPWILLKGIYFGTLVNFIRLFKGPERNALLKNCYGDISKEDIDSYKDLLSDSLFICLEYRNLCAHGGRVYNYIPKSKLRPFNNESPTEGLSQLLFSLKYFKFIQPYNRLDRAIVNSLNDYCHAYPNDVVRIENATGFKIAVVENVWINPYSNKYHTNQFCSGSKNCQKITLEQAIALGYSPCKRCCRK